jgi:peptide/nickel transport system substrate-binding protein
MISGRDLERLVMSAERRRLNRRELVKRGAAIGLGASALSAALTGVTGSRRVDAMGLSALLQESPDSGVRGGKLTVANIGEPNTLDAHQTTDGITAIVGYCGLEGLFTYDKEFKPIPELVDQYTISEDGLTQRMTLRQNVPFHNGKILDADDVIASVTRWGQISGVGKKLFASVNELARIDDHTIEFRLKKPYGTIPIALAHNTQSCVIYPKSVVDQVGTANISDPSLLIGTGPYKLQEWKPDAYIRYVRFDDFAARDEPINGYGGRKYAWVDQIDFVPVPDEAARVAGMQAGDYHLAINIGNDQYETLKNSDGVIAEILPPTNWEVFYCNWKSPIMSKLAMRQAMQALYDMKPMLLSGRGSEEFIRLDPGHMMVDTPWHTLAGGEYYDMKNLDLAKQKLQEAGYDGEPIRFLTTQEFSSYYGVSVVAKQQMESIGIKVDFRVSDWATVVEQRAKPDAWDMFVTNHGFVPDPTQIAHVGQIGTYPGWWDAPDSMELAADLAAESDFDTRFAIWEKIQTNLYTQIPTIKVGDSSNCSFRSDKIRGWTDQIQRGIPFWNLWFGES